MGYGYVLGVAAAVALLALQDILGLPLGAGWSLLLFCAVSLGLCQRLWTRHRDLLRVGSAAILPKDLPRWSRVAFGCLAGWVLIRGVSLAIELLAQGLYAWDAWSTWIFRARVWVEAGKLTPFVAPEVWLSRPTEDLMALPAAHYPKFVSLVAAWPVLALGRWSETVALLPWLLLYPAMAAGLYGQCRIWGASPVVALVTTWLFLSLPLVGGQIALAGYADIWLATFIGFAFMSFLRWARDGDVIQGVLALALVIGAAFIKAEGLVWGFIFVLAALTVVVRARTWWMIAAGLGLAAFALAFSGGVSFELPAIGQVDLALNRVYSERTGAFEFALQNGVLRPLLVHLFVFDTWHLLMVTVVGGLVWSVHSLMVRPTTVERWARTALVWVLVSAAAFSVLFFWTSASEWVRLGTSGNRIILHFSMAFVFWLQCLWTSRSHLSPNGA